MDTRSRFGRYGYHHRNAGVCEYTVFQTGVMDNAGITFELGFREKPGESVPDETDEAASGMGGRKQARSPISLRSPGSEKTMLMIRIVPAILLGTVPTLSLGDGPRNSARESESMVWTAVNKEATGQTLYDAAGNLPDGAPPVSSSFTGVVFTGRYANYTKADTWYPTWSSDGHLYSPWTDGTIGEMPFVWSAKREKAETGYARIEGQDPLGLTISNWGVVVASALPYQGRYPCGSLVYDGVWYYGTYFLDQPEEAIRRDFGWYVMGPFAGFRWSTDSGKTWHESPCTASEPLFVEPARDDLDLAEGKVGPFVKMGAPHVVDFGKNMEHSPDGKAYLVGHGAEYPNSGQRVANNSWVTGDAVYMTRVTPGIETMNDRSKYELFAGRDKTGGAIWSNDFRKIQPIFGWEDHCGIVTMTYNPPLQKFFMCITDGHRGTTSRKHYTSYILESDRITGPWTIVAHMTDFGPQAYFLNIPSKFISKDGNRMYLCYSANYMDKNRNSMESLKQAKPIGSGYALSLHEFRLVPSRRFLPDGSHR